MPLTALSLALAAAVLHAAWNLLLARAADSESASAVAFTIGTLAFAPLAIVAWDVDAAAVPYLGASAALQLAYLALLARAYARARFAVVYPVARGSAPVLVLVVSALFLAARPGAGQLAGVVLIALGVVAVRGVGEHARPRDAAHGLAIGSCIAGYTLVDAHGLEHAAALPYLVVSTGTPALAYAAALGVTRGLAPLRRELRPPTAAAGLAGFAAYGLVLLALTQAPPAPVAAVRETSVLIAAVLGGALLGERATNSRLLGAAAVSLGIATLALG